MSPAEPASAARDDYRLRVVVAGGGPAALEGILALRALAGGRVKITMVSDEPEFLYRPLTVLEPFSGPRARTYDLAEIAADLDIELVVARVAAVDIGRRQVELETGGQVDFDALLVALGARPEASFSHTINVDYHLIDEQLHGLVQDVEFGSTSKVAFLVPPAPTWYLPLYELALMTADRGFEMNLDTEVTIITPEPAPLAVFGIAASDVVQEALKHRNITVVTNSAVHVIDSEHLVVEPGHRQMSVKRIVALPQLFGRALPGLPSDERGFIPIGSHCEVTGVSHVFAAGDGTDFPVKQGGIATQEAVAAAESIAALAGVAIDPQPFRPVMHAIMYGPRPPIYLRSRLVDGEAVDSAASTDRLWPSHAKIDSRYLSPYLEEFGALHPN